MSVSTGVCVGVYVCVGVWCVSAWCECVCNRVSMCMFNHAYMADWLPKCFKPSSLQAEVVTS